ncbi:hypothetical protein KPSA1_00021 [Pseudomonas syringae pv. actinidiae]|uniref:Uncharacterized protein n=1 Tax=Pseudomonas syringae pv. actinidiae TaxID=103796 RepID=A0A2V0QC25_PSESF|nr:hypothetical protein KPSA1_00021 [Pseudomonas syringae pv. actinidiae]
MLKRHAHKHLAEQFVAGVTRPTASFFIVIEVKTTRFGCQPELTQRLLTAENKLRATFELDG